MLIYTFIVMQLSNTRQVLCSFSIISSVNFKNFLTETDKEKRFFKTLLKGFNQFDYIALVHENLLRYVLTLVNAAAACFNSWLLEEGHRICPKPGRSNFDFYLGIPQWSQFDDGTFPMRNANFLDPSVSTTEPHDYIFSRQFVIIFPRNIEGLWCIITSTAATTTLDAYHTTFARRLGVIAEDFNVTR